MALNEVFYLEWFYYSSIMLFRKSFSLGIGVARKGEIVQFKPKEDLWREVGGWERERERETTKCGW